MALTLRPYQETIIDETRRLMLAGCRSIVITSPTGSGKTLLTAYMLKTAASKGMHSWFINHRRELIKQSIVTFGEVGVKHGVISAGFNEELRHPIQVGSIQTLARRINRFHPPSLIVWDECHHIAAGSWAKIYAAFPNAFHIGLTATPERLDSTGLGKWFRSMVHGPSVQWLIQNNFLSSYKLYAPAGVSVDGIKNRMGDYSKPELISAADKPSITGDAIKHYQKHGAGKRAVVFCVSIEHSKHVVDQFLRAGIPAEHVDGETDTEIRDRSIRRFKDGEILVLSNVELFGEGFDLPALEVAILLRPTQSLGLYLQQVGRSLRPSPGKERAIILDHAGNCERHGLPDEERIWSLEGRDKKRKSDAGLSVRVCPKCFAAQAQGRPSCAFCGYAFPGKPREVEQKEGDLREVDIEEMRRKRLREQGKAETFDDLVALGKSRGYKRPFLWAKYLMNARQARKLRVG